jgi:TonB family protein
VEPQYSEEARKARYQGTVVLEAIVRKDGTVDILRVVRSLGFGLDENAIQALKQWRFRPGTKGGLPVDVALNIEVNFNLR